MLQSFAETIFFFNPAVLWISSLLREERENCCDDIAISRTQDKKLFIHALVAFQEYSMQTNKGTVVAFNGGKKILLNRVKRIIYNENKKLNAMEKGIFIFSIVATSFIGLVSMKQTPPQKSNQLPTKTIVLGQGAGSTANNNKGYGTRPVEFKSINSM
jgi:beta-lactamase regulating signal transducer with metallopeptidase domain